MNLRETAYHGLLRMTSVQRQERPLPPHFPKRKLTAEITWGTTRKEICFWMKLREFLARMSESDRWLLVHMAQKMAQR